jgi:hypothetical protein
VLLLLGCCTSWAAVFAVEDFSYEPLEGPSKWGGTCAAGKAQVAPSLLSISLPCERSLLISIIMANCITLPSAVDDLQACASLRARAGRCWSCELAGLMHE